MNDEMILVTGATGKTGRRVVRRLREQGVPVRAASPSSPVRLDWNDRTTWDPALEGARAVYLVVPDLGSAQAADDLAAFSDRAAAAGVQRAVLISFPPSDIPGMEPEHVAAAEQAPARAGLEATVLRLRWFFQNFSEDFLHEAVLSGDVRLPAGNGTEAFLDAEDIAAVAVEALTQQGHAGNTYELSGPRPLSFAEAVADIARATGRPIGYTPLSPEAYAAEQRAHGVPEEWVRLSIGLYAHVRSGVLGTVTGDVERVLGRPPRDFADYAREAATQGAWNI